MLVIGRFLDGGSEINCTSEGSISIASIAATKTARGRKIKILAGTKPGER